MKHVLNQIEMLLKIGLIVSIFLQIATAVMAIRIVKYTKYNISWILLTIALLIMAFRRFVEYMPFFTGSNVSELYNLSTWLGIIVSIFVFIAFIYIRRIFKLIKQAENDRNEVERRIINAIIETEEKERKRFAKDLHDGLGPLLSGIKMLLSGISVKSEDEQQKKIKSNLDQITNEAITAIKEVSNSLSPHLLTNLGLLSALKSLTDKINNSQTLRIVVNSNIGTMRYNFNTEVILYRVLCELINNTLKHARANLVNIDIFDDNNQIKMYYYDNGIGFDYKEALIENQRGMGLANIETRLKAVNGKIRIKTRPGAGIQVEVIVDKNEPDYFIQKSLD